MEKKYCFIDTNTLIHFQTFDEVDWPTILSCEEVILVFTSTLYGEIDKHSNDPSNSWRQSRAKTIKSKFKTLDLVPNGLTKLREGTLVLDASSEPTIDFEWARFGLDNKVPDDRLLARLLEFKAQNSQTEVYLMTNDFGFSQKARSRNVVVLDTEKYLKELERDELEVVKLRKELDTLRNRLPQLNFGFLSEKDITNILTVSLAESPPDTAYITDAEIEETITQRKVKLKNILQDALKYSISIGHKNKFNNDYQTYLTDLENALKAKRSYEYGQRFEFAFCLENVGSSPAQNIDIHLEFPLEYFVIALEDEGDDFWGEPDLPFEPVPEWLKNHSLIPPLINNKPPYTPVYPRGPLYSDHYERHTVSYEHNRLPHKQDWVLDSIVVYTKPGTKGGFQIKYRIHEDNLIIPVEGVLNVVLKSK